MLKFQKHASIEETSNRIRINNRVRRTFNHAHFNLKVSSKPNQDEIISFNRCDTGSCKYKLK